MATHKFMAAWPNVRHLTLDYEHKNAAARTGAPRLG